MSMFGPVTLEYNGSSYSVDADNVFALCAEIEEHITLIDLYSPKQQFTKLAKAYAAALNFAGCKVDVEEVYSRLFISDGAIKTNEAIAGLLMILIPPEETIEKLGGKTEKKPQAAES